MALTDLQCRKTRPGPKLTKLSDTGGLQLWVYPNGTRAWRCAYRFGGKQKLLALGQYPATTLLQARMGRDKALLEIEGIPMARRVAEVMRLAGCIPVFAVGPARLAAGLDVVSDDHPGEGPLGGILTALRAAAPGPV